MSSTKQQRSIIERTCQAYLSIPAVPITAVQAASSQAAKDRPAKGDVTISRSTFPAPAEDALKDALFEIMMDLKQPQHIVPAKEELTTVDVGVEFLGKKRSALSDPGRSEKEDRPGQDEDRKLREIEKDRESDMTVLYMHGGGLYFSSPADYRTASTRLARLTGGIVASTSYRLCPQNTFPAPVLDVLLAYTSLLHPPTSAHPLPSPTPASKIVLAGNSAGVNLAFGLLKFLLEWNKRPDPTLVFHGKRITLPLPAGITAVSGWCDPTDCLPSWLNPNAMDILTPLQPALLPSFPSDQAWPSSPPREHPYTRAVTLDHELVCPAAVQDWTGAPPMWFTVGELERGRDGNAVVASQAAISGVRVQWNEWQGMCHEWTVVCRGLPQIDKAYGAWAEVCRDMVLESSGRTGSLKPPHAVMYRMPDCEVELMKCDVEGVAPLEFDIVRKLMRIRNGQRPLWTGGMKRKVTKARSKPKL